MEQQGNNLICIGKCYQVSTGLFSNAKHNVSQRVMICNSLKQLFRVLDFRFSAFHCLYFFLMFLLNLKGLHCWKQRVCSMVETITTETQKMRGGVPDILIVRSHPLFFCSLIYKHQYSGAMRMKRIWLIYIMCVLKWSTTKSNVLVTYTEISWLTNTL